RVEIEYLVAPLAVLRLVDGGEVDAERPPRVADRTGDGEVRGGGLVVDVPVDRQRFDQPLLLRGREGAERLVAEDRRQIAAVSQAEVIRGAASVIALEIPKGGLRVSAGTDSDPVGELRGILAQLDVDEPADEVAGQFGRIRLHDVQRVDEIGRKEVER